MRYPLRFQIFVPFGMLSVFAVMLITLTTAWMAARRGERDALARLESVVKTLRSAQFPFTSAVLSQMHGLSSAEFMVRGRGGEMIASTLDFRLPGAELPFPAGERGTDRMTDVPSVRIAGADYFAAEVPLRGVPADASLLVLLPVRAWRQLQWEAAVPPLLMGVAVSVAVLLVAGGVAGRLTRRLTAIRTQVASIADGNADRLSTSGPDDELRELATAVNSVSHQLRQHERTVRQTERMRLVAQLSSGLSHQLRNAASGARLAIELVKRRHPDLAARELDVAMTQLEVIEDHLRRLLSAGPESQRPRRSGSIEQVIRSVEDLATPVCRHAGVRLEFDAAGTADAEVVDFEGLRSGILNLVMNAMEAAGRGGEVAVSADLVEEGVRVAVSDTGSGPLLEVADRIFEPFVTSKPEGIGLGLAFVRRTVDALGGKVSWRRDGGRTRFELTVPVVAGACHTAPTLISI